MKDQKIGGIQLNVYVYFKNVVYVDISIKNYLSNKLNFYDKFYYEN